MSKGSRYELRQLNVNDGIDIYVMLQELGDDENNFISGVCGKTFREFKGWLAQCEKLQSGTGDGDELMRQANYWLYVEGRPVGYGMFRYDGQLYANGSNLKYCIRPTERSKGYGGVLLGMLVDEAKRYCIKRLMLITENSNIRSLRVAMRNNGRIEKITDRHHYIWIDVE